jgi:sortase (surface protein transpeptidase)
MSNQGRSRRAWPILITGAGLVVLLVAAFGLINLRATPDDFGALRSLVATSQSTTRPHPQPVANADTRSSAVDDTSLPAAPVTLSIPALQVQAPVEQVRSARGSLGVPENPAHVGWWIGSALPGALAGTVIIDGHVDSAVAGMGALFRLTDLGAGDQIVVTTTHQRQVHYVVEARRVLSKANPLAAELFTTSGPPRLVLITCGGPFDRKTLSYEDNIVVVARFMPAD